MKKCLNRKIVHVGEISEGSAGHVTRTSPRINDLETLESHFFLHPNEFSDRIYTLYMNVFMIVKNKINFTFYFSATLIFYIQTSPKYR